MPQRKRAPSRRANRPRTILATALVVVASILLIELYTGPRPVNLGATALEDAPRLPPPPSKTAPPLVPVAPAVAPWKATAANTSRPPEGYVPLWSVPSPTPDRLPSPPPPTPPPDPSAHRPPEHNPNGVDGDRPPRPRL
jgi:hypothetical protein